MTADYCVVSPAAAHAHRRETLAMCDAFEQMLERSNRMIYVVGIPGVDLHVATPVTRHVAEQLADALNECDPRPEGRWLALEAILTEDELEELHRDQLLDEEAVLLAEAKHVND